MKNEYWVAKIDVGTDENEQSEILKLNYLVVNLSYDNKQKALHEPSTTRLET